MTVLIANCGVRAKTILPSPISSMHPARRLRSQYAHSRPHPIQPSQRASPTNTLPYVQRQRPPPSATTTPKQALTSAISGPLSSVPSPGAGRNGATYGERGHLLRQSASVPSCPCTVSGKYGYRWAAMGTIFEFVIELRACLSEGLPECQCGCQRRSSPGRRRLCGPCGDA